MQTSSTFIWAIVLQFMAQLSTQKYALYYQSWKTWGNPVKVHGSSVGKKSRTVVVKLRLQWLIYCIWRCSSFSLTRLIPLFDILYILLMYVAFLVLVGHEQDQVVSWKEENIAHRVTGLTQDVGKCTSLAAIPAIEKHGSNQNFKAGVIYNGEWKPPKHTLGDRNLFGMRW